MAKLHYTEKFFSLQGEALYTGVPSVFLRMFGCNFKCKNFGRYEKEFLDSSQTHNPEVVEIIKNIDLYKTFNDLPLVKTGCDSYSSVYPEFKRFVVKETASELATSLVEMLPTKQWGNNHLVITGGEPLLGWQRSYPELLDQECMKDLINITFETNGTQPLSDAFKEYLNSWKSQQTAKPREVLFSVSPKLPCSGEAWEDAINPTTVTSYQQIGPTYLKFVISSPQDVIHAQQAVAEFKQAGFTGDVYFMPVAGTTESYAVNAKTVAEYALQNGIRFSDRLHLSLFGNQWGT